MTDKPLEEVLAGIRRCCLFLLLAVSMVLGTVFSAHGTPPKTPDGRHNLVILTSFAQYIYDEIVDAFKSAHPQYKVWVMDRKTPAALSLIQEGDGRLVDVFWASSPVAFELLRQGGYLQPLPQPPAGMPLEVRGQPLFDPSRSYGGFAAAGYGFMWSRDYLERRGIPPPGTWLDLAKPLYRGHLGMSTPYRSGTTHIIVESILQLMGWEQGWGLLMEISGNLATITARSYSVRDGVLKGRFGIGLTIDFFGLSAKAQGYRVEFTYPPGGVLAPANIAILGDAPHPEAARDFVRFIWSLKGQRIMFKPTIRRLPVLPAAYDEAPPGYPNPFREGSIPKGITLDLERARVRYYMLKALFDQMITYRLHTLKPIWHTIHKGRAMLEKRNHPEAVRLLNEAGVLIRRVPVSEAEARSSSFCGVFQCRRPGRAVSPQQAEIEHTWEARLRENASRAQKLAERALELLESQGADR